MITITLKSGLSSRAEDWLAKNVGPRLHYIHNSVGGEGWMAKLHSEQSIVDGEDGKKYTSHYRVWKLTFEDDSYASWFLLQFPQ